MIKYLTLSILLSLLSNQSIAQEALSDEKDSMPNNICAGAMSSSELIMNAQELRKSNDNDNDFFATNCLILAAHKGSPEAQYLLGLAYKKGQGIPQSPIFAYKWVKISEINGENILDEEILEIEESMTSDEIEMAKAEINDFMVFEKKLYEKKNKNLVKETLKDYNQVVTPDQLSAIEKKKAEIDALFNSGGLPKEEKEITSTSSRKTPSVVARPAYTPPSMPQIPTIPAMGTMPTMPPQGMYQPSYTSQAPQPTMSNNSYQQSIPNNQTQSNTSSNQTSSSNKGSKKIDFYTDKYNPQFNAPTSSMPR